MADHGFIEQARELLTLREATIAMQPPFDDGRSALRQEFADIRRDLRNGSISRSQAVSALKRIAKSEFIQRPMNTNPNISGRSETITSTNGENFIITEKFFGETANKNYNHRQIVNIMQAASDYKIWIRRPLQFLRWEMGQAGHPHEGEMFNVFQVEYQGRTMEFKALVDDNNKIYTMRFGNSPIPTNTQWGTNRIR